MRLDALLITTLVATVFNLSNKGNSVEAKLNPIRNFKELLNIASELESAEAFSQNESNKSGPTRNELLYVFARESKSLHCSKHFDSIIGTSDEYIMRAKDLIEESKRNKNWFTSIFNIGGPISAMKFVSRNDPFLSSVVERHEIQAKTGRLAQIDVDCDIIKFQIRSLHTIMFILQTDIKYLLVEDQQTLNQAIYEKLKADKFISQSNFFVHTLTPVQKELFLQFFADRVDLAKTTIGDAVDHFYNPGEFIIGRLLETCQSVLQYKNDWKDLEFSYNSICPKSTSDPNGSLFTKQFKFDKYDEYFEFCTNFMDAL